VHEVIVMPLPVKVIWIALIGVWHGKAFKEAELSVLTGKEDIA